MFSWLRIYLYFWREKYKSVILKTQNACETAERPSCQTRLLVSIGKL